MDKKDQTGREARRTFLKSMALTGGGVAVAVKAGSAFAEETVPEAPAAPKPTGYHETQHIRDYYAKADF